MNTLALVTLPIVALAALCTPAAARSVRVSHADLALATPGGQQQLHQRLRAAARSSCARMVDIRDLTEFRGCVDDALAGTAGDVTLAIANARGERFAQRPAF